ncbi:LysR family transcriptional regulator [Tanticharoenia sakaeratensis]|uniref:Transcriptional regulator LysR family n=1 Tax=Tanticharoenia sakaeratensis NBRC 103193 TaxID=1231623 RepID=A0A0D6ML92_9PROT|nr:LysR family transcriptional regulator [Tanticharoenia sakaeratensis]GAN54434.1 transcriptional regulator LysR family [Tanticharoenia sakaeratensis NBRC 103193]GBQ24113.1 LysR family transcriptional regulator [Tanticharoenia sakaeratensis NBRC 103193]
MAMLDPHKLLNRLKLRHLTLLIELENSNNLHKAAERMNLSQPSTSKMLQDVEYALETQLFSRTSHGVFPTASGVLAARYARLMLNDLSRMQRDIVDLQSGVSGSVQLGAIVAGLPQIVSPAMAKVAALAPDVAMTLQVDTSDALMVGLRSGRFDFIIGRTLGLDHNLASTSVELGSEPLCVVSGREHAPPDPGNLTLADLSSWRWIFQTAPSPMRRAIEAAFTMALLPAPPHPIEAASMFATADLLRCAPLLAVMPCQVAEHYENVGVVKRLSVEIPDLLGPFSLITPNDRPLTAAAAHVRTAILEQAIGNSDRLLPTCG